MGGVVDEPSRPGIPSVNGPEMLLIAGLRRSSAAGRLRICTTSIRNGFLMRMRSWMRRRRRSRTDGMFEISEPEGRQLETSMLKSGLDIVTRCDACPDCSRIAAVPDRP